MLNSVVSRALIHCLSVSQLSHVPLCALMFRLVYWCAACVLWLMFCSAVWTDVPPVCSDVPLSALNWCATLCTDVPIKFWFAVVTWCAANLCARIHLMLSIDADFAIPWTCQTPQQYCPTSPSSWFPVGRNFLSHAEVSLADLWHVMARGADFGRRLLASVIEVGVTVTHWKSLWASLRQSTVPLNWLEDSSSSIYGTVHAAHLGRILSTDWWMTIWFDSTKLLH